MTADEAKTLGQAAVERLRKSVVDEREWQAALRDLSTALDLLHDTATTLAHNVEAHVEACVTAERDANASDIEAERLKAENATLAHNVEALTQMAEDANAAHSKAMGSNIDLQAHRDRLIRENNALRKNNERLTKENAALRQRAAESESALQSTATMAAHWKLKAQGGNYDATQEDCPGCAEQWNAALEACLVTAQACVDECAAAETSKDWDVQQMAGDQRAGVLELADRIRGLKKP